MTKKLLKISEDRISSIPTTNFLQQKTHGKSSWVFCSSFESAILKFNFNNSLWKLRFACSFYFTCKAVKERFELRATPPGGKTVLRTVFSDDRRYLQSIGLNFRICFANIKRKISPPQPPKSQVIPEIFCFLRRA